MNGSGVYGADVEAIKSAEIVFNDSLECARSELERIRNEIEVIGNSWSGKANEKYMKTLVERSEALRELIFDMQEFADSLYVISKEYSRSEEEIDGLVSLLRF